MKFISSIVACLCLALTSNAQLKDRFSIQGHYGPAGNFFVRSYDEYGGPPGTTYFYKKNFLGTIAGIEARYSIGAKSQLGIAFSRSNNKGVVNYSDRINGVDIYLNDFSIRHINDFYQLFYERSLKESGNFSYHAGVFLVNSHQQEIDIDRAENLLLFDERNFKNSGLQEGGMFAGIRYDFPIDTHLNLGLQGRLYYLISTGSLEAVTLTPTLSYRFISRNVSKGSRGR